MIERLWEEKNYIEMKTNCENKNEFAISDITSDTKKKLNNLECIDTGNKWTKKCPSCSTTQTYKNSRSLWNAKTKNTICLSCKNSGSNNPFYGKFHSTDYKNKLSSIQKAKGSYRYKNVGGNPKKIEKLCKSCNSQYFVVVSNGKSKYCSYKCALVDNFGIGNGRMTAPEIICENYLKEHNITYKYGFELCGKIFDFYIPEINTLIEIDGVYWHGKNKTFTELNEVQLKNKKNDEIKNKIAVDNGYKLVRIWEDEIKNVSKYIYR